MILSGHGVQGESQVECRLMVVVIVGRVVARGRSLVLGRQPQTSTILQGLRKRSVRVRDVLESGGGAATLLRDIAAYVGT